MQGTLPLVSRPKTEVCREKSQTHSTRRVLYETLRKSGPSRPRKATQEEARNMELQCVTPVGPGTEKALQMKTTEIWLKIAGNSINYLFRFSAHLKFFLIITAIFPRAGKTELGWQWVWDQPELHNGMLFRNPRSRDRPQWQSTCLGKAQFIHLQLHIVIPGQLLTKQGSR